MEISRLQQEVREELARRGFSLVRFTRPPLDGEAARHFSQWIQEGRQGEMSYLERRREERLDPERLLEGWRSLIVMAYDYDTGFENARSPVRGHISRYAWGDDYHQVLGEKLRDFQSWLRERSEDGASFASVDASPVLEKSWARQAGLGWMGKHTNVIHEQKGSYFFLSALLTRLPFLPDAPASDRCGACTECIDVCPTRAIVAPYVLDARLCISYLTIELKGPIPRRLRPLIGNHIFGCDDCQEVCPWNRFSQATGEARFFPREGVRDQPLARFLSITEEEFKSQFQGAAILRAKRRGFLRNVLVAIGNSGDSSLAEAVLEKFSDPEPLVRGHAAWAYARLRGREALAALEGLAKREADSWVLQELAEEFSLLQQTT